MLDNNTINSAFGQETSLKIDAYASPKSALSDFKAGIYDLLLPDIKMPEINSFELYEKLKNMDSKPKVCFITAFEIYYKALRKDFPDLDISCFIKKLILISDMAKRIKTELNLKR